MNENVDLTKILKYCPKGTTLYSTIYGEVEFDKITELDIYSIIFITKTGNIGTVTSNGKHYNDFEGDCTLFPSKEQRAWSKFIAPWYKKKRDNIAWLKEQGEQEEPQVYETEDSKIITYSETDGYKFVEPKFHKGQWIAYKGIYIALIINIVDNKYEVEFLDGNKNFLHINYVDRRFHLWTIQDAKDGDILAAHDCYVVFKEIDGLNIKCYCTYHYLGVKPGLYRDTIQNKNAFLPATKEQCNTFMKAMNNVGYKWNAKTKTLEELIKPKFDPNTLQPFDRVLVRDFYVSMWRCNLFSHIIKNGDYPYQCSNRSYLYCIPYNDETKHLVGTTDEASEYYRYWED